MANNVLISIEQENKTEAEFMSRSFVDKSIKNRAYVNALGAELVIKYLNENGVDTEELHNIHSISKILERVDLADILLPNIHIDARVVFDEDKIFIPKTHFELHIQPDIYVVAKLNEDFESVELLGYIESDKVDFKNSNKEYYFVEKDELESVSTLINYVKNFSSDRETSLSEADILTAREMSISMADHDIDDDDFKKLLSLLLKSDSLRNSLLEFDNFELLSYNAVAFLPESIITEDSETITDFEEEFKTLSEDQEMNEISESIDNELDSDSSSEEDSQEEPQQEDISEEDLISEDSVEDLLIDEDTPSITPEEDSGNANIGGIMAAGAGIIGGAAALAAGGAAAAAAAEGATMSAAANTAAAMGSLAGDALEMGSSVTDEAMKLAGMSGSDNEMEIDITEEDNTDVDIADLPEVETEDLETGVLEEDSATDFSDLPEVETEDLETGMPEEDLSTDFSDLPEVETEDLETGVSDEDLSTDFSDLPEAETEDVSTNATEESSEVMEPEVSSETDLSEENIEISEEVFDGDDTIEGISDDFGGSVEGEALPEDTDTADMDSIEITEENPEESIDLTESADGENIYDDDIFAQFVQEDETQTTDAEQMKPASDEENTMSFTDLEQMNIDPVSSVGAPADLSISEAAEPPVVENSTTISDKTFAVGEIPIDINMSSESQEPIQEELEGIYNSEYVENNDSMLNNNVRIIKNNPNNKKNPILLIVGALIALALIGTLGFKFLKPAAQEEPVVDDYIPEKVQDDVPDNPNTLKVDHKNIAEMNKKVAAVETSAPEQGIVRQSRPISPTSYINVSKISWEVPDYVSYSPEFRQYFQSTGRSLKLALTSDLLMATEYAYSNQVKVSVSFDRSGAFKDSRIVQSSGSSQVDKIVLQTVNQTLSVLKSPASLRDDENTTVILKIYF